MGQKYLRQCIAGLLLMTISFPISGQSLSSDLGEVSKSIEDYFRLERPEWKHQTIPPGPLGTPPSPNIVIHQWSSERCLTAEVLIDSKSSGKHPVPCRIKLVMDRSESESAARARLSDFVMEEHSANPISVGDKGYVFRGTELVFVKGKFTFWLAGSVSLRVGDFSGLREFMDRVAKEVAMLYPPPNKGMQRTRN